MSEWYVAVEGKQQGPMSADEVRAKIRSGEVDSRAHVFTEGMSDWQTIAGHADFAADFDATRSGPPPAPRATSADEIDYEVFGEANL